MITPKNNNDRVQKLLLRLFVSTDNKDWDAVRTCFHHEFLLDMTSLVGGHPVVMTPSGIIAAWDQGLRDIDYVHHQIGNIDIAIHGIGATANCYGIAYHFKRSVKNPIKHRSFIGAYDFRLISVAHDWKITHMTFKLGFIEGNASLE